jgi:PAS domain S-box-containing protein
MPGTSEPVLENLKTQFDQLQLVFTNVSEGVIVVDADGKIVDINPTALTMYGFEDKNLALTRISESDDIIESTYLDGNRVPKDDLPLNRLRRGETFYSLELLVRRVDTGYTFFANYNGTCAYDTHHKMIVATLTFRNVTERKRMEDAISTREAEYRAIFELAGSGTMQMDPHTGRLTRVNPKMTEITGYSAQELLTMTWTDLTHPDDRPRDIEGLDRMLNGELP